LHLGHQQKFFVFKEEKWRLYFLQIRKKTKFDKRTWIKTERSETNEITDSKSVTERKNWYALKDKKIDLKKKLNDQDC